MANKGQEYVSESGRRLQWRQFTYAAWKRGGEGGSIIFEGEVFEPVEESKEIDDGL